MASSRSPVLFLDGGLGTSLQDDYGVAFDKSTPLWSSHLLVSDQATLLACQSDFGRVPVDIILTATYQVSIEGFAKTRTAQFPTGVDRAKAVELIGDAVRIAGTAGSAHGGKVALSVGPYGACMVPGQEYSGKYDQDHSSLDDLKAWHLDRLRAFAEAGGFASPVSYIALETIPRLDEIIALRKALDETSTAEALPFWISCVFPGEEDALPDGTSVQAAVFAMLDPGLARSTPWGLGINCTKIWKLERLIKLYEAALAEAIRLGWISEPPALVLYPDGTNGEVYNTTTQTWELPEGQQTAQCITWDERMADIVREVQDRGQWKLVVVGGCCKASHVLLSRLRRRLEHPESNN